MLHSLDAGKFPKQFASNFRRGDDAVTNLNPVARSGYRVRSSRYLVTATMKTLSDDMAVLMTSMHHAR